VGRPRTAVDRNAGDPSNGGRADPAPKCPFQLPPFL